MSFVLLYAALLGAVHGLNPSTGWLIATYQGLRYGAPQLLTAAALIFAGHVLSMAIVLLPGYYVAELLLKTYRTQVALALGFLMIGSGAYLLLRGKHCYFGLQLRPEHVLALGAWLGLAHSMPLPVIALSLFSEPLTILFSHSLAFLVTMTAMALAFYKILGLSLLKRYWINFHLIWSSFLIVTGVLLIVTFLVSYDEIQAICGGLLSFL